MVATPKGLEARGSGGLRFPVWCMSLACGNALSLHGIFGAAEPTVRRRDPNQADSPLLRAHPGVVSLSLVQQMRVESNQALRYDEQGASHRMY